MAAFFIDLDGTIVHQGTNDLIDGVIDRLKQIKQNGHQLFITTKRGSWPPEHVYGRRSTERFLKSLEIEFDGIVFDVESPRIVINDGGAIGITHPAGEPWDYLIGDKKSPITKCAEIGG